jgi:hypothetical protein
MARHFISLFRARGPQVVAAVSLADNCFEHTRALTHGTNAAPHSFPKLVAWLAEDREVLASRMKWLVDMNLSLARLKLLRDAGWEADHWPHIARASAPDSEVMAYAAAPGLVVVRHDLDVAAILVVTRGKAECCTNPKPGYTVQGLAQTGMAASGRGA